MLTRYQQIPARKRHSILMREYSESEQGWGSPRHQQYSCVSTHIGLLPERHTAATIAIQYSRMSIQQGLWFPGKVVPKLTKPETSINLVQWNIG